MHKDRTLYECNEKEIEELLLGHKIVADENNDTLILDNGVRLLITPNSGCDACPSGNYYLERIASVNNAITNVEFVNEHEDSEYEDFEEEYYQHYKIFVIADGMTTELLDVYGTDGNGYYGTGYTIDVYLPDED